MMQVVLDEHNNAQIANIGLGKLLVGQDALASAATFFWAAPEQLQVSLWHFCSAADFQRPKCLSQKHPRPPL